MTDIVSRQAAAPAEQLSPTDQAAGLDVQLRRAEAIAGAVGMVPAAYRGKPGAVILAEQWAMSRGIDLLTTMQTVSFVEGKPVVDATMLRALTEQAGYSYEIDTDDKTYATFSITRPEWPGPKAATFTVADAEDAKLLGKNNWKGYLGDMLVARATTRCLRRYAPGVMVGIFIRDEVDEPFEAQLTQPDPVDVITGASPEGQGNAAATAPPASDDDPEIVDAEIVEEVEDTTASAGPVGEPPPPPEPKKDTRTVEELTGNPDDAVFDNPPATSMPKPAAATGEGEIETVAGFKGRVRADYGWTHKALLKAMAENGRSVSFEQIVTNPDHYQAALDLLETEPTT